MSVQAWHWSESVKTLTPPQYYPHGEMFCPPDVLQSYVRSALLHEGVDAVQFEPGWYFFNLPLPLNKANAAGMRTSGDPQLAYNAQCDAKPTRMLSKVVQALLDPTSDQLPPSDLGAVYDRDQQRYLENDWVKPPLNFASSTLLIHDDSSPPDAALRSYASFADGRRWQENTWAGQPSTESRIGSARSASRIELQGDAVDEVMVVDDHDGQWRLSFLTPWGFDLQNTLPLPPLPGCEVVGVVALNVISALVGPSTHVFDPDELVVASRCSGQKEVSFSLFNMSAGDLYKYIFQYRQVEKAVADGLLNPFLGPSSTGDLLAMGGLRLNTYMLTGAESGRRSVDALCVARGSPASNDTICISCRSSQGSTTSVTLPAGVFRPGLGVGGLSSVGHLAAGDFTQSGRDNLYLLASYSSPGPSGGDIGTRVTVQVWEAGGGSWHPIAGAEQTLAALPPRGLFALRQAMHTLGGKEASRAPASRAAGLPARPAFAAAWV